MIFAIIENFRYDSENTVIGKIEIFAMHNNFRYGSEILARFITVPLLPAAKGECPLACVMPLPHFSDVCSVFSVIW